MSEFDLDNLLAGALDDYREQTMTKIKPSGTALAYKTATHRKRVHVAAMSVLALALVAAPITAYATVYHGSNAPPNVAALNNMSPAVTPSITPSETPSVTPSTTPSASSAAEGPTQQDLNLTNATLDFPSGTWASPPPPTRTTSQCPTGTVRFTHGENRANGISTVLSTVVSVDLDHDGVKDAVAVFECHLGDPSLLRAIGFRRGQDGSVETMGVVETASDTIRQMAASGHSVQITVADLHGTATTAVAKQTPQVRTYTWNGTRFIQSAGSTSFTISDPNLSVQLSDMVFAPANNGTHTGTMTVTLHNGGPRSISNASVINMFEWTNDTNCRVPQYAPSPNDKQCAVRTIAPGGSAMVTIHVTATDPELSYYRTHPKLSESGDVLIQINLGDRRLTTQPTLGNIVIN